MRHQFAAGHQFILADISSLGFSTQICPQVYTLLLVHIMNNLIRVSPRSAFIQYTASFQSHYGQAMFTRGIVGSCR